MTSAEDIAGAHVAPDENELPPPGNPMAVARELLDDWRRQGQYILRHWRGSWMTWRGPCWVELEDAEVRSVTYQRLEYATYIHEDRHGPEVRPWAPTKRKVSDVLDAQAAIVHLSGTVNPPTWIGGTQRGRGPMISCANGLLDVADRRLISHDPSFFNLVAVPFDYSAGADCPRWLRFLGDVWPHDADQVKALQEWFGYVISGRTDLHKILLTVGPTRSGKGTIARVLTALIGKGNVAGPTLASLGTNFGLSPLLGKPLAIISDARLGGRDTHQVTERLLTVSGEDTIDVDRKYRDPWTGKLPTRFLILSNELPHFGDASGVIANRFLVLTMTASWLGKENTALTDELTAELPGILNWALEGLARLEKQGRFTEPASSADARTTMQDMASPTSAFVRERCQTGPEQRIVVDELWTTWKTWCEDNGHKPGNKGVLARNLRSVVPQLRIERPHGQKRQYVGVALASNVGSTMANPSGSSGSRRSEPHPSGSASGSSGSPGTDATTEPAAEPRTEPPVNRPEQAADLREPLEPPDIPIVEPTFDDIPPDGCAVPDCPRPPRRQCRTCADHMDREAEFRRADQQRMTA